jgi:DNA-binding MarR family transcriptional regulator
MKLTPLEQAMWSHLQVAKSIRYASAHQKSTLTRLVKKGLVKVAANEQKEKVWVVKK